MRIRPPLLSSAVTKALQAAFCPPTAHHLWPIYDECFPVEMAAGALHAGTFCHTKFNHFYLPSTALSKCWHGHFRTGLIISGSYDGHYLYLINPERPIFAEHHTAVGQQRTAFPELSMKIQSCLYDVYCFLSLFYCSHLFLVPGPLGELRPKEYLF